MPAFEQTIPLRDLPAVSLIVVSFNSRRYLGETLTALLHLDYPPELRQIIVVDNASSDDSATFVRTSFPTVKLIEAGANLGFGGGCNLGIRASQTPLVALVNPDALLKPDWLLPMVTAFKEDPLLGAAGSKIWYPDGVTIQHAGGLFHYPEANVSHSGYGELDQGQYEEVREFDFITAAAAAYRREALESVACFDETFWPAYFEDIDLCFRLRKKGWHVLYIPRAHALHHESVTVGHDNLSYYDMYFSNRLRFVLRHYTTQQLYADFIPYEIERIRGEPSPLNQSVSRKVWQQAAQSLLGPAKIGKGVFND